MSRNHARRLAALERAKRDRPPPGMSAVRYPGVSGFMRQAHEDGLIDEHGELQRPCSVNLNDPRPESGIRAMLWDALQHVRRRDEERTAEGRPLHPESDR